MRHKLAIYTVLSLFFTTAVQAQPIKKTINDTDVLGFKIGMTLNEAHLIIQDKYKGFQVDIDRSPSITNPSKQVVSQLKIVGRHDTVNLVFSSDLLSNSRQQVVRQISYEVENSPNAWQKLTTDVVNKYGNPTVVRPYTNYHYWEWCDNVVSKYCDITKQPSLTLTDSSGYKISLTLDNPSYVLKDD